MKELVWLILIIVIGAILLTMEIGYCVVRDTIDYIKRYLKDDDIEC
jgi:hypothetical protein